MAKSLIVTLIHVFSLAFSAFLSANILRPHFWRSCNPGLTLQASITDGSVTFFKLNMLSRSYHFTSQPHSASPGFSICICWLQDRDRALGNMGNMGKTLSLASSNCLFLLAPTLWSSTLTHDLCFIRKAGLHPLTWVYKFMCKITHCMPLFHRDPPILYPTFVPGGPVSIMIR